MNSEDPQPYIGLTVDYYPKDNKRLAAIVIETTPNPSPALRHICTLFVLDPDEQPYIQTEVDPVDHNEPTEDFELKGRWGFAHEYAINDEDDNLGTLTNEFVGQIPNPSNAA